MICPKCKRGPGKTEFYERPQGYCKPCMRAYNEAWRRKPSKKLAVRIKSRARKRIVRHADLIYEFPEEHWAVAFEALREAALSFPKRRKGYDNRGQFRRYAARAIMNKICDTNRAEAGLRRVRQDGGVVWKRRELLESDLAGNVTLEGF